MNSVWYTFAILFNIVFVAAHLDNIHVKDSNVSLDFTAGIQKAHELFNSD
jgi:hypothetical protein